MSELEVLGWRGQFNAQRAKLLDGNVVPREPIEDNLVTQAELEGRGFVEDIWGIWRRPGFV